MVLLEVIMIVMHTYSRGIQNSLSTSFIYVDENVMASFSKMEISKLKKILNGEQDMNGFGEAKMNAGMDIITSIRIWSFSYINLVT